MDFEWDSGKAVRNLRKHRVSFEDAITVFRDPLARTWADPDHSTTEAREITIGRRRDGRLLFVAHVERRGRMRIISARLATPRERRAHENIED
jgi:uncharacterized DUF497 family protein